MIKETRRCIEAAGQVGVLAACPGPLAYSRHPDDGLGLFYSVLDGVLAG